MLEKRTCDLAIVGGGLAGGLIALALRRLRPELEILLIESGDYFGGNHLWSYFSSDVAPEHRWLTAPLVTHGWSGNEVRFPGHNRQLDGIYYSIESERLDTVVRATLAPHELITQAHVLGASARAVVLGEGERIEAKGVIDCRGAGDLGLLDCGWQKFVGMEFDLADAHDLARPIVMDAQVEQIDGYRFVYCLPFAATRMFIEDTYYSDTPDIDRAALRGRASTGWSPRSAWARSVRSRSGTCCRAWRLCRTPNPFWSPTAVKSGGSRWTTVTRF